MKKFVGFILMAAIAIVVLKMLQGCEVTEGSRVAAMQERARSATTDRIKDPRDGITETIDAAITDAAEEMKGTPTEDLKSEDTA